MRSCIGTAAIRFLLCSMVALVPVVVPVVGWGMGAGGSDGEGSPLDPIGYIRDALQTHPIVCLGEGNHQASEPHRFLRRLLSDTTILKSVDVIIVEFAASRHQAVLDAYIAGEDVPSPDLSKVWRDTTPSPRVPWDSPLYFELLKTIRQANLTLAPDERVRVIAGDPPIEWEKIKTREDYDKSIVPRDPFVASLAMEQAFDLGKRVLIIFGGAHLPRVPVGPEGDLRNSLTSYILKKHPGAVTVIEFLNSDNLGISDRLDELVPDKLYVTADHWTGAIDAKLVFPEVYSLVTDAKTGRQSWQEVPLYSGYRVRDLFDALIYIGPSSDWSYVPDSLDQERDKEYLEELNRRSLVRFGRALDGGQ